MFFFKKKQKKEAVSLELTDPRADEGHCFISGNVYITGEVQFGGTLRVDGRIDGKVSVYAGKKGTLIVSKGAFINGPVSATHMIIDGTIQGDVVVEERLECRSHSLIQGEIYYGSLQTSEGAQLKGRCTQKGDRFKLKEVTVTRRGPSLATRDTDTAFLKKTNFN